jgi:hypothetical protein
MGEPGRVLEYTTIVPGSVADTVIAPGTAMRSKPSIRAIA